MPYVLLESRYPVDDAPCMIEKETIVEEIRTKSKIKFSKNHNYVCLESPAEVIKKLENLGYHCHGYTGSDICRAWTLTKGDYIIINKQKHKNKKEVDEDGSEKDDVEEVVANSYIDDWENIDIDDSEFDESDEELESSEADECEEHNNDSAEDNNDNEDAELDGLNEIKFEEDNDHVEPESSDEENELDDGKIEEDHQSKSEDENIYELDSSDEEVQLNESELEEGNQSEEEEPIQTKLLEEDVHHVEVVEENVHQTVKEEDSLQTKVVQEDACPRPVLEEYATEDGDTTGLELESSLEHDATFEDDAIDGRVRYRKEKKISLIDYVCKSPCPSSENVSVQAEVITNENLMVEKEEFQSPEEKEPEESPEVKEQEELQSPEVTVYKSRRLRSTNVSIQNEVILYANNENLVVVKEEPQLLEEPQEVVEQKEPQSPEEKVPQEFQSLEVKTPERSQVNEQEELQSPKSPEIIKISLINYVRKSRSSRTKNVSIQNEVITNENLVVREEPQLLEELHKVVEQEPEESPEVKEPEEKELVESPEVKAPEESQLLQVKEELQPQLQEELEEQEETDDSMEDEMGFTGKDFDVEDNDDEHDMDYEANTSPIQESTIVTRRRSSRLVPIPTKPPSSSNSHAKPRTKKNSAADANTRITKVVIGESTTVQVSGNTRGRSQSHQPGLVGVGEFLAEKPAINQQPTSTSRTVSPGTTSEDSDLPPKKVKKSRKRKTESKQSSQRHLPQGGERMTKRSTINQLQTSSSTSTLVSPRITSEDSDPPPKEVKKSKRSTKRKTSLSSQPDFAQGEGLVANRSAIDQQQTISSSTNTSAGPSTTSESSDIPSKMVKKSKRPTKRKTSQSSQPDLAPVVELLANIPAIDQHLTSSSTNTSVAPSTTSESSAIPPKYATRRSTKIKTSQESKLSQGGRDLESIKEEITGK